MELTPEVISTIEQTIRDRISIYRGGPYTIESRLSLGRDLVITLSFIDAQRWETSYAIARSEIENHTPASLGQVVDWIAVRIFESQLQEYLRAHPAPASQVVNGRAYNWGSVRVNIDGQRFEGVTSIDYTDYTEIDPGLGPTPDAWGVFGDLISQTNREIAATLPPNTVVEVIEPKIVRTSRYQLLASGESLV
jgi:hypothetical protein